MHIDYKKKDTEETIYIVSSKSYAHRLILMGAFALFLSENKVKNKISYKIKGISEDIYASLSIVEELGLRVEINPEKNKLEISKVEGVNKDDFIVPKRNEYLKINCQRSGSTLRFVIGILALLGEKAYIDADDQLKKRPLGDLIDALKKSGIEFSSDSLPFFMSGRVKDYDFKISASVSSQYISGLMMGIALAQKRGTIEVTSEIKSKSYIDITKDVLGKFGYSISENKLGKDRLKYEIFQIQGKSQEQTTFFDREIGIEGDWSNAAFFIGAGILRGKLKIEGLNKNSVQGDRRIIEILKKMGAKIYWQGPVLLVEESKLRGGLVDLKDIPDLFPILTILASQTEEGVSFFNCDRLVYKESNRIISSLDMVQKLSGEFEIIRGKELIFSQEGRIEDLTYFKFKNNDIIRILPSNLHANRVDSYSDHRIQMAATIASLICEILEIKDDKAYKKSYVDFYRDFVLIGGSYVF